MKFKRVLIVLSILALAALACNLGAGGGSPTDTSDAGQSSGDTGEPGGAEDVTSGEGEEPSDSGDSGDSSGNGDEPGQTGSPGSPAASIDLDDPDLYAQPDLFNTYRTAMDYTFEAEGPITGTVLLDSATQVDPYATTVEFYTYGSAVTGGETVYTFTQILDTQYAVIGGFGCQSGIPGIQENPFEVMLDTGGMLMGEAQYAGEDSANGVDTYVYTITMDNIDLLDTAGADVRSISNGQLHIARDGGYAVRLHLEGRGVNLLLSSDADLEGDVYYELNFYDFDAPVTIEIPPSCAEGSETGSTYPTPEDATNVVQLGDTVLTFSTGLTPDEVVTFYSEAMAAHGCSAPTTAGDAASSISMEFTGCEFGTVSIIILPESESSTSVSIFGTP